MWPGFWLTYWRYQNYYGHSIDNMCLHGFNGSRRVGTVPTSGWMGGGGHVPLVPPPCFCHLCSIMFSWLIDKVSKSIQAKGAAVSHCLSICTPWTQLVILLYRINLSISPGFYFLPASGVKATWKPLASKQDQLWGCSCADTWYCIKDIRACMLLLKIYIGQHERYSVDEWLQVSHTQCHTAHIDLLYLHILCTCVQHTHTHTHTPPVWPTRALLNGSGSCSHL
jgi:hypothetical protein